MKYHHVIYYFFVINPMVRNILLKNKHVNLKVVLEKKINSIS